MCGAAPGMGSIPPAPGDAEAKAGGRDLSASHVGIRVGLAAPSSHDLLWAPV